jgi:hypothetical protein
VSSDLSQSNTGPSLIHHLVLTPQPVCLDIFEFVDVWSLANTLLDNTDNIGCKSGSPPP